MTNRDTLIVTLSDLHTGSTQALCPDRFMEFAQQGNNHTPNSKQVKIYEHFQYCAGEVLKARKDKRLVIVVNGDAVEGHHHNASQLIPCNEKEQADLHIELMGLFKKWTDYHRGDLLYYTIGTEVHSKDYEHYIGEKLIAEQDTAGLYAFNDLKIDINGKRLWWTHHGPQPGKGHNKGNGLRNWLKVQFYEAVNEGKLPPHMMITAHVHNPWWDTFTGRYKGKYFPIRGLICPSWQQKTRYANGRIPFVLNKVGLQFFTVSGDGQIHDPVELIM